MRRSILQIVTCRRPYIRVWDRRHISVDQYSDLAEWTLSPRRIRPYVRSQSPEHLPVMHSGASPVPDRQSLRICEARPKA